MSEHVEYQVPLVSGELVHIRMPRAVSSEDHELIIRFFQMCEPAMVDPSFGRATQLRTLNDIVAEIDVLAMYLPGTDKAMESFTGLSADEARAFRGEIDKFHDSVVRLRDGDITHIAIGSMTATPTPQSISPRIVQSWRSNVENMIRKIPKEQAAMDDGSWNAMAGSLRWLVHNMSSAMTSVPGEQGRAPDPEPEFEDIVRLVRRIVPGLNTKIQEMRKSVPSVDAHEDYGDEWSTMAKLLGDLHEDVRNLLEPLLPLTDDQ